MSEKRKCTKDSSAENKRGEWLSISRYLKLGFLKGWGSSRPECVICGEELADRDARERFCDFHTRTARYESQTAQSDPFKYVLINRPRSAQPAN